MVQEDNQSSLKKEIVGGLQHAPGKSRAKVQKKS